MGTERPGWFPCLLPEGVSATSATRMTPTTPKSAGSLTRSSSTGGYWPSSIQWNDYRWLGVAASLQLVPSLSIRTSKPFGVLDMDARRGTDCRMTIEAWWPRLRPETRQWLIANNGDAVTPAIAEEIANTEMDRAQRSGIIRST